MVWLAFFTQKLSCWFCIPSPTYIMEPLSSIFFVLSVYFYSINAYIFIGTFDKFFLIMLAFWLCEIRRFHARTINFFWNQSHFFHILQSHFFSITIIFNQTHCAFVNIFFTTINFFIYINITLLIIRLLVFKNVLIITFYICSS